MYFFPNSALVANEFNPSKIFFLSMFIVTAIVLVIMAPMFELLAYLVHSDNLT